MNQQMLERILSINHAFLLLIVMLLLPTAAQANPADPSVRRTVTLPDGRTVEVVLSGDEHLSYWRLNDGSGLCLSEEEQDTELVTVEHMTSRRRAMRKSQQLEDTAPYRRLQPALLQGTKRVPVIMVQFSDVQFLASDSQAFYGRLFNEQGFSEGRHRGSVRDYFLAQSNGKLELLFDVYGPVTLSNTQAYYGDDEDSNKQKNMSELLKETVALADKDIDFSLYDWDGDGRVDIVDVTMTVSHILGQNPVGFNRKAADVTGDDKVDIVDVTSIIDIILGKQ